MKAAAFYKYGPPSVITLEEVAVPAVGEMDVLVRNEASIISPSETAARSGSPFAARLYFGLLRPKWPVLGNNFAGTVTEVGNGVTRFAVGDRVTGFTATEFGAHAEFVRINETGAIMHRPASVSAGEAVAILDGGPTALPFLRDGARLQAGQSILVNGASGAVGSAVVQLAHLFGANVTAVCSARNDELVRSLGADHVIDYATEDFTSARNKYDVIIDAVGMSSYRKCRAALTTNGIYLTTVPTLSIMLNMLLITRFTSKKAKIVFAGLQKVDAIAADIVELGTLAAEGKFRAVIDQSFPLERMAEAHAYVETKRKRGSAIVTIGVAT
jgi:NADPH:quinone reductase-like Zn-dependent oxidoreductase